MRLSWKREAAVHAAGSRAPDQRRRVLIAGPYGKDADGIANAQLTAFLRYRRAMRSALGLSIEMVNSNDLETIARACDRAAHRVSAFLVRPDWRVDVDVVSRFFAGLRARYPGHWIVAIDPWDQCTGRFLGLLAHVDRLVKYQALKNRDDYYRPMVGGTVLTDYLWARGAGDRASPPDLGSEVPPGAAHRIVTGWYFNTAYRRFQLDLLKPRRWPFFPRNRHIDIVCHVSIGLRGEDSYYGRHRMEAIAAIRTLASEFCVRMSADYDQERTVSRRQYLHDCRHAKIMVSPFGWGEVSTRDYEAALYGALLVRPRIDHVSVLPDIFVAGETYVPVAWDWSDLADKCRYYLTHWAEAQAIIDKARARCLAFFEERRYLDVMRQTLGIDSVMPADDSSKPVAGEPAPLLPA